MTDRRVVGTMTCVWAESDKKIARIILSRSVLQLGQCCGHVLTLKSVMPHMVTVILWYWTHAIIPDADYTVYQVPGIERCRPDPVAVGRVERY